MNDKVLKKTQDTLGKIVKKPPLTEKLLNKPPFRFLHDVMTAVIKNTGFMTGLFPDADLASENVKEKDSKIAFLQTAIDFVAFVNNKAVSARPSKIVAGQEPEKTNEFLQSLAEAINRKVKNEDFVKRFHAGERQGKSKPPSGKDDKKKKEEKEEEPTGGDKDKRHRSREDREKSRDRERSKDRGKDREKDRDKEKDKSRDRDRSGKDRDRDRDKDRDRGKDRDKERSRERGDRERDKDRDRDRERRRRHRDEREDPSAEAEAGAGEAATEAAQQEAEQEAPARIPRPSSAKGSRRRHRGGRVESSDEDEDEERQRSEERRREEADMNGGVDEDDLPPQVAAARKMARPSSARPAAPRIKRNEAPLDEPPILGSGGSNVPNVIVDRGGDSDDDDLFVTKEDDLHHDDVAMHQMQTDLTEDGEHGGLVKKILETKKELEGGSQQQQPATKKVEIEKPAVNDAARRKEREMVQKEVDRLRGSIQTLTRSANPLGKIMDYVQEDLDQMQKELEMWKRENKQNAAALQREQSITEKSVEPLKVQLKQLEQQTQDQLDLLAAVKSNIFRNDAKIEKMLGSITKS